MNTVTQTTRRKVEANFISDIISLPQFQTNLDRTLAYANIIVRLTVNDTEKTETFMARTNALVCKTLEMENTVELTEAVGRINREVHILMDEDNESIWALDGTLSERWDNDLNDIAIAIEAANPDPFMPTSTPELVGRTNALNNFVSLVTNNSRQTRHTMPSAMAALDVLFSQAYTLNPVIMSIKNIPLDLDISKNYSAKQIMLREAEEFQGTFHFQYTLDHRGRIYARSRLVTPQGSSFDKAVLNFAEAKPLGEYGLQALMIHYANVSGHDKLSFAERMYWARTKGSEKAYQMNAAKGDWLTIEPLIEDTKHAFEEYSAAIDFYNAYQCDNTADYLSSLVTHQDATNSGFQFGAALTGDRETAFDVNLTDAQTKHDLPADLYGKMAINLNKILAAKAPDLLKELPKIDRKFCKTPIMVTGYGAGIKAVMTDVAKDYPEIKEGALEELKEYMKEALQVTASSMLELTEVLRNAVQDAEEEVEKVTWTTPDGFRAIHSYRTNEARKVQLGAKLTAYVKLEKGEIDPMDEKKMATALPPNFIHSIDAQMLRTAALVANENGCAFSPIHDSFGTHAATFFELNDTLKQAFVETMSYDWIGSLNAENKDMPSVSLKTGDYKAEECRAARYMFS